jgi:hypothetical protein
MKGQKEKKIVCVGCNNPINQKKDNYVAVSTFNRISKPDHHDYFHFTCWVDFFNDRVSKRAKQITAQMRDQALSLMNSPMIKTALLEVPNFQQVLNMMNTPLTDQDKVKSQIQNGRKKRNSKTKMQ